MFVFVRAITYAALFIGFVLIYLPARVLSWAGLVRPTAMGVPQIVGMVIGAAGAAVAVWCVFTFATKGKGTPAPFDQPRRLVMQGPYRFVRNPMYIGATLALASAALFYQSWPLLAYAGFFFFATHLFVVAYEEPTLRQSFGPEYEAYCRQVSRWWPRLKLALHSAAAGSTVVSLSNLQPPTSNVQNPRHSPLFAPPSFDFRCFGFQCVLITNLC